MPFYLYSLDANEYRQIRKISLAGKRSPFPKVWIDAGRPAKWHASENSLLYHLAVERPPEHRILFDLKPKDKERVSLYRLRDVWGYSDISVADGKEDGWTPLALRLEGLFVDKKQDDPETFKRAFTGLRETRDFVYEFLYLKETTENGIWTWGQVGSVNGALLWPDALRYFANVVNHQFNEDNSEPLCP